MAASSAASGPGHVPAARPRLGPIAVLHPFPSLLDALVTVALAAIAGAGAPKAAALGLAMLGFQASIGATNDLADAAADARAGRPKPIPAGQVAVRTAKAAAVAGGFVGIGVSTLVGLPALVVGLAGYGVGLAYDGGLKRRGLGALCFAVALPLLPAYATLGATSRLPPRFDVVLVLAAVAGLALAVSNALADVDEDAESGTLTVAVRLGRGRSLAVVVAAQAILVPGVIVTALQASRDNPWLVLALATGAVAALLGVAGTFGAAQPRRRLGWEVQALGLGILAVAWFAAQLGGG